MVEPLRHGSQEGSTVEQLRHETRKVRCPTRAKRIAPAQMSSYAPLSTCGFIECGQDWFGQPTLNTEPRMEHPMNIEKQQVIDLLKSRGEIDQAEQAGNELPDNIDSEKDNGLLDKFGLNPDDFRGIAGALGGAGG